jgi:hypothetical protein
VEGRRVPSAPAPPPRQARSPQPRPGAEVAAAIGNRAMARVARDAPTLARWLKHPQGKFSQHKAPDAEWKENNEEPKGVAFAKSHGKWYRWDGAAGTWVESEGPGKEKARTAEKPEFSWEKQLDKLPDPALAAALRSLPLSEVKALRTINKRWERVASRVLRERLGPLMAKTALSSLDGNLLEALRDKLAELAPDQLLVLSDQVTPSVVEELTQNEMTKRAVTIPARRGRGGRWEASRTLPAQYKSGTATTVHAGEHKQAPVGERHGNVEYVQEVHGPVETQETSKMHVKSMVGTTGGAPKFLETGSANLTTSAMKGNTESVVVLEAPGIAKMFGEYASDVTSEKTTADDPQFAKTLEGFNRHNPAGIRAALAPFVNVGEQLTAELKGADMVVVRMFLVSDAKQGPTNQPVEALCELARSGVHVRVTVDRGQAEQQRYVNEALRKLERAGAHVSTETGPRGGGIMHDKLVFAHYPANPRDVKDPNSFAEPERWTVMIGSSGLTRNVIENLNYENLLIIDDEQLYTELMRHDTEAFTNRTEGTPALKPAPRRY